MPNLVLSDDETVALALLAGRPWPAPLPTVDADDPDQLLEAGQRGLRSLAIRELIKISGTEPGRTGTPVLRRELAEVSAAVFGAAMKVVGYAATEDLSWLPGGLTTICHATGTGSADIWTLQVVSHAGVSYFSPVPATEAREMLSELLRSTAEAGLSAPQAEVGPAPRWYCVSHSSVADGQAVVLAVAPGEHRLHRWDGEVSAFTPVEVPGELSAAEAVLWSDVDRLSPTGA